MTTTAAEDLSAYAADAELSQEEKGNILAQITRTARELRDAQADEVSAAAMLKTAQDRVRNLTENVLPLLMDEAQQKFLVTQDGWSLKREEIVRAGISQENMPQAAMWLNANGHPIVKREVSAKFDRGEEQLAAHVVDAMREAGAHPTDRVSVHPQTLSALVRELLAEGKEFPQELFGVYVQALVKQKRA